MLKKITILVAIIVLVAALFIIGYIYNTYISPEDRPDFINSALEYLPFGTPSGNTDTPPTPTTNNTSTIDQTPTVVVIPSLRKITHEPVAGAGTITRTTDVVNEDGTRSKKTVTSVRYIERGTGHITEIETESNKTEKISNTTIPRVYDALFGAQAASVVLRYTNAADEVQTYGARILVASSTSASSTTATTQYKLDGAFLPLNIADITPSPNRERIAYLERQGQGIRAVSSTFTGGNKTEFFTNPLREWLVQWPLVNTVYVTTKAAGGVPGFLYRVNMQNGSSARVLGPLNGLTTLVSSDASHILYSETLGSAVRTISYDTATGGTQPINTTFPAEKCVWSSKVKTIVYCGIPTQLPLGTYPNDWYQGRVSFNDTLVKINVTTGRTETLVDPSTATNESIDAISLTLDQNEDYLIFRNKKDSSLWQLRLKPLESN